MQQAAAIKLTPKHQRACGRMITVATKIDPTPGKVKLIKKTVYAVPKSTTPHKRVGRGGGKWWPLPWCARGCCYSLAQLGAVLGDVPVVEYQNS